MPSTCCIKNCKTTATTNGRSLHKFPMQSDDNYREWLEAIGPHLKESTDEQINRKICDLHFDTSCFIRGNTRVIKDGHEIQIPRQVLRLKQNSVPTIFNKLEENPDEGSETSSLENIPYDISSLIIDLKTATKSGTLPRFWHVLVPENGLGIDGVVLLFNKDVLTHFSRSVYVRKNMTLEIRADGNICKTEISKKITSFEDLMEVLTVFGSLRVCPGVDDPERCPVGLFEAEENSDRSRCDICQKEREMKEEKLLHSVERPIGKPNRDKMELKNLKRKLERASKRLAETETVLVQLKAHYGIDNKEFLSTIEEVLSDSQREALQESEFESGEESFLES